MTVEVESDAEIVISAITECMNGSISWKLVSYVANICTEARQEANSFVNWIVTQSRKGTC